jgi:hypothetical protein
MSEESGFDCPKELLSHQDLRTGERHSHRENKGKQRRKADEAEENTCSSSRRTAGAQYG